MTRTTDTYPNVVVIQGAASNAVRPFIERLPTDVLQVHVWNTTRPPDVANAVTVHVNDPLEETLRGLVPLSGGNIRLGLVLAAVKTQERLLTTETDASIEAQLNANVMDLVRTVKATLPVMIRSRFGRIAFLSSFRSQSPTRGTSIYAASKSFGEVFIKSVALEYGRFGVSASSIRMGYFEGGIMAARQERMRDDIEGKIAFGRMGTGELLAEALEFTLSQPYLSGGCIDLNGGLDLG